MKDILIKTSILTISTIFVCWIFAIVYSLLLTPFGLQKKSAENTAYIFAKNNDIPLRKAVCTKSDDDDGYVSCTFVMKNEKTKQYKCKGWPSLQKTCKEK